MEMFYIPNYSNVHKELNFQSFLSLVLLLEVIHQLNDYLKNSNPCHPHSRSHLLHCPISAKVAKVKQQNLLEWQTPHEMMASVA